jgi:hypothetical protein
MNWLQMAGCPSKKSRRLMMPRKESGKATFASPQKRKVLMNGELEVITQTHGYTFTNTLHEGSQRGADATDTKGQSTQHGEPKLCHSGPQQDRRYRNRKQCANRNCSYQPFCGRPETATVIHLCSERLPKPRSK